MKSETRQNHTRAFNDVSVGEKLPNFNFPISVSFVVGSAVASRDFTPVHHDKAAANAAGLANVFPNILADNGLVGRYLTDWAGPESTVKRINIKLGAPVMPGEDLKFTGEVVAKEEATGIVDVKVTAKGNWGMHLDGIARVQLPK